MSAKDLGMQLAYPLQSDGVSHGSEPGMTKREAFAMAAMQGSMADPKTDGMYLQQIARQAVEAADFLLDELAKEPT